MRRVRSDDGIAEGINAVGTGISPSTDGFMKQYEQQQRTRLNSLLDAFAYLADDDTNYERAVYAILNYADQTGLALQHRDFDAFRAAMCSEEEFVLR